MGNLDPGQQESSRVWPVILICHKRPVIRYTLAGDRRRPHKFAPAPSLRPLDSEEQQQCRREHLIGEAHIYAALA